MASTIICCHEILSLKGVVKSGLIRLFGAFLKQASTPVLGEGITLRQAGKQMTKCDGTVTESDWRSHAGLWYYC